MPSQRHLVSLAIDCWIQVSLAKRYEVPFSPIHSERSVRGIQWFLQHFEKRALGERLRVLKMSPPTSRCGLYGGSAELYEGDDGVDLLTHHHRQCMAAPSTKECCKPPEKP